MISRSRYLRYNPALSRNTLSLPKNLITLTLNRIKNLYLISKEWREIEGIEI